jgi:catechol 2,3-dioxygenase-like lactoylglutathione lyase family enzyme
VTKVVPFLRVADAEASAEWYGGLGFTVDWRHRFAPHLPLFISMSNGEGQLFLSEHTGDARPDTLLYLYVANVDAVADQYGRHVQTQEYGMREIELVDPDGNRLRLGTPVPE